ncbi:hypothetical protein ACFLX3_02900 [Chloroflexota bacterium]
MSEELSNALSRILDNDGSLINVINILYDLHNIYSDIESKNIIIQSETDKAKLAILLLELSKLRFSAAPKWIELTPLSNKLYEDVTALIKNTSDIKMKLIS